MDESAQGQLILLFSFGTVGMLILVVGVIFFSYQKRLIREEKKRKQMEEQYHLELVSAILKSQESERKKIADNVHDNLSAMLYAIQLSLVQMADGFTEDEKKKYGQKLKEDSKLLEDAIDSTKMIARVLVPVSLGITGISGSLRDYCGRLKTSGLNIEFTESGISLGLKKEVELNLFRISQELISNSIKHSSAKSIILTLEWDISGLTVKFFDDGIGFIYPRGSGFVPTGMGVLNILGRLEIMGAEVLNYGDAEKGFCFIFRITNEQ
jgi:two-component system NarL family sensor kinase